MSTKKKPPFRLILLGNMGVGKTSIALCIIRPGDLQEGKAIHPFEFKDTLVNLEIRDTRGKEMVSALDPSYYDGADAAMLVFDGTAHVIGGIS